MVGHDRALVRRNSLGKLSNNTSLREENTFIDHVALVCFVLLELNPTAPVISHEQRVLLLEFWKSEGPHLRVVSEHMGGVTWQKGARTG